MNNRPCNVNDLFLSSEGLQCGNCGALVNIGHYKIVSHLNYDNPDETYYTIEKYIMHFGQYMTLPGIYCLVSDAMNEIERLEK